MTGPARRRAAIPWGATARTLLALASPVMLSRFGIIALTIIDSVMVGRVGVEQLAFLAVASQPQGSMAGVGQGLMGGLPAEVVGAKLKEGGTAPGRWLASALFVSAVFGLMLAGVMALGESLLAAARQSPELVVGGAPVLLALAWAMPAVLMYQAASLYLESMGRPRLPLYIVIAACIAKILLNLALLPGWGALGAAIGTSILRWAMLAAILLIAGPGTVLMADLGHRDGWIRLARLMRVGAPVALATLFEVGGFLTFAGFAGALGSDALAGYQIARNLYQPPHVPPVALGLATSIYLAGAIAQGDRDRGWRTVRVGLTLNNTVAACAGAAVALMPMTLGGLFTNDPDFLATLRQALLITAALIVFDSVQGFLNSTLRGLSDGLVPSLAQLVSFWGVGVPLAYVFAFPLGWGLDGVLAGLTTGLAVASVLLCLRLWTHPKLSQRTSAERQRSLAS